MGEQCRRCASVYLALQRAALPVTWSDPGTRDTENQNAWTPAGTNVRRCNYIKKKKEECVTNARGGNCKQGRGPAGHLLEIWSSSHYEIKSVEWSVSQQKEGRRGVSKNKKKKARKTRKGG